MKRRFYYFNILLGYFLFSFFPNVFYLNINTFLVFFEAILMNILYHMGVSILYRPQTGPPAKSKSARLILGRRLCFVNRWPCRLRFSGGRDEDIFQFYREWIKSIRKKNEFLKNICKNYIKMKKKFIQFFQDRVLAKKKGPAGPSNDPSCWIFWL